MPNWNRAALRVYSPERRKGFTGPLDLEKEGHLEIRPLLCGVSWARGTVPLPHDKQPTIEGKQNDRQFQIEGDSPGPPLCP